MGPGLSCSRPRQLGMAEAKEEGPSWGSSQTGQARQGWGTGVYSSTVRAGKVTSPRKRKPPVLNSKCGLLVEEISPRVPAKGSCQSHSLGSLGHYGKTARNCSGMFASPPLTQHVHT